MTAPFGEPLAALVACSGWEDEDSPAPTCFPEGCAALDEYGECSGNALRLAEQAGADRG